MEVLPVLDLLNGVVVRGIAGRRTEYQPLRSQLTTEIAPLRVARALRERFGFTRFYVADLDAILHRRPNEILYRQLIQDGFELQVDAGIRTVDQALSVRDCDAEPIIGLESCPGPDVLAKIVDATDGAMTFSLDLQSGRPLLPSPATWSLAARGKRDLTLSGHAVFEAISMPSKGSDPFCHGLQVPAEIVRQVVACGVKRIIVLDLADVGTSSGGQTHLLCRTLLSEHPELELTCGGGVRGYEDLLCLKSLGAKSVLVASALHDGRLVPADLASL